MRSAEIAVAVLMIAFATAMLVAGRSLGANPFEPIGSGTVPNAVAWITLSLALVMLVRGGTSAPSPTSVDTDVSVAADERRIELTLVALLTIGYVLVLASGRVRYQWATLAFVPAVILLLSDDRRRALPWALGVGATIAFGLDYVFRHVLVADIP